MVSEETSSVGKGTTLTLRELLNIFDLGWKVLVERMPGSILEMEMNLRSPRGEADGGRSSASRVANVALLVGRLLGSGCQHCRRISASASGICQRPPKESPIFTRGGRNPPITTLNNYDNNMWY